jgi:hypothetical protein
MTTTLHRRLIITAGASFALASSLALTGCSVSLEGVSATSSANPGATDAAGGSSTPEPAPRNLEENEVQVLSNAVALDDSTTAPTTGSIILPGDITLSLDQVGTLEATPTGETAAEGQQLRAATFDVDGALDASTVIVLVDGRAFPVNTAVEAGVGTVIASVPEDADTVELGLKIDGVTQTVSLDSGERTSTGIAEAWYTGAGDATVANAIVSREVPGASATATYRYSVDGAQRAPWTTELGWAENGTKTWVVLELQPPEWTVSEGTALNKVEGQNTAWLTDQAGARSDSVQQGDTFWPTQVVFLADPASTDFTLSTESSAYFEVPGLPDQNASFGPVSASDVALRF